MHRNTPQNNASGTTRGDERQQIAEFTAPHLFKASCQSRESIHSVLAGLRQYLKRDHSVDLDLA